MTSEADRLLAEEVRLRDQAAADLLEAKIAEEVVRIFTSLPGVTGATPVTEVRSRLGKTLDELRAEAKRNVLARMSWHLIPSPIDQNWCAHWRNPMDMMRQG
jgi:hypothetical protein